VVVVSSAIRPGNPEVQQAHAHKIPVIPRAEMLAEVMRLKHGIAVAGTHGKTTTTSLIAHVLSEAGLDPTAIVGGRVIAAADDRTGTRLGEGPLLVAEADESDGSFLRLAPVIAVVTNIEAEHLDHYGSERALFDAFAEFAAGIPFWGLAVLCLDHPGVQTLLPRIGRRVTTYGFQAQADLRATQAQASHWGMQFHVKRGDERVGPVELPIPGVHNVQNALAALAVAVELEIPLARAAESLATFPGVERRFETKGSVGAIRVVDDYGHHPTEIRATLAAARAIHAGRIVVVFQPHRYTRTRDLFDDFAAAFHDADVVVMTEIYAAGEPKLPGVESASLVEAIAARGHRSIRLVPDLERVPDELVPSLQEGDLVITLGAGSVNGLGAELLRRLGELRG